MAEKKETLRLISRITPGNKELYNELSALESNLRSKRLVQLAHFGLMFMTGMAAQMPVQQASVRPSPAAGNEIVPVAPQEEQVTEVRSPALPQRRVNKSKKSMDLT